MDDLVNMDVNEASLDEFQTVAKQLEQIPVPQDDDIPDKFKGKSQKDLIKMYQEAEKVIGRQGNEVAEVRRLADQLIQKQLTSETTQKTQPEISEVDFFADPVNTVNKVVATHPAVLAAVQKGQELDRLTNKQKLVAAHSDYQAIIQEPEFAEFVLKSPIRKQLFQAADKNYDFEAADELLTTYKELRASRQKIVAEGAEKLRNESTRQLKSASVDAGGTGETGKKIYRRADLIRLQIQNPDRYAELQPEIFAAYAEGRIK